MRITGMVIFCSIISLAGKETCAADGEARAKITAIVGKVEVRSAAKARWRAGRLGMTVKEKWDIRSYLESEAEVTWENGTVLKIGENSIITLSRLTKDPQTNVSRSTVKVMAGKVWGNVKKLTETRSEFEFETPTAVASIRGTRLGIDVAKRRTIVDVYEGTVLVRRRDRKVEVKVTSSTRAVVDRRERDIAVVTFQTVRKQHTEDKSKKKEDLPVDPFVKTGDATGATPATDTVPSDTVPKEDDGGSGPAEGDTAETGTQSEQSGHLFTIKYPKQGAVVEITPLMVRGTAVAGADVTVGSKVVSVADDGSFSQLVDLNRGKNTILVAAMHEGQQQMMELECEYRQPLMLKVNNIEDGMEVTSRTIQLDIEVNEGAHYSVNGAEGATEIALNGGDNTVTVEAWDEWDNRRVENYRIILTDALAGSFTLKVAAPSDGAEVHEPYIQVTGSTLPDARVFVNEMQAPVGREGFFSLRIPIPDEPYTYNVEVRAERGGKELVVERTVSYTLPQQKLELECSSPAEGQVITGRVLRVAGKTLPRAMVTANGIPVSVASNGVFSRDITLTENDIGDLLVEVVAQNQDDELVKSINCEVSGLSPQINTSIPILVCPLHGQQATVRNSFSIQLLDRTPDDELELTMINNGASEVITTDPGKTETILLNEGKNVYSLQAVDRAGNVSQAIRGTIYYLPGPIIIMLNEPSSNPMVVEGLPPVMHPGYTATEEPFDVEVEIDDGIGNVPESIRHCRVTGNGQTVLLRNKNDYIFTGRVNVRRGNNRFTVRVEDVSGRLEMMNFSIVVE